MGNLVNFTNFKASIRFVKAIASSHAMAINDSIVGLVHLD